MKYPQGMGKRVPSNKQVKTSPSNETYRNRGMSLEEDIHITNTFYLESNRAIIHKKPTPVQIVNVHYPKRSAAVITEAYFQAKSTTDFNGIYRGKHIDFEAKETKNKTLFPLANFHEHQFKHMEQVLLQGGICFAIIRFRTFNETYYFPGNLIINYWHQMINNGKKSIPYSIIQEKGHKIPFTLQKRVDYLSIVDQLYFS
ncbi:MAG TPA: Holliday junction resolvase RecU [Pseudogracilibacillus sp.]|nr:Holliday junction resolvase RecU [Pseudogracilibacillus sp.]